MSRPPVDDPGHAEALLLDEMLSPELAAALRADGFDVIAVAGHPILASAPDEQVAAFARREGRRVVTENARDFAAAAGGGEPALRVLFTSSRRFPRSRRNPGPLLKALREWLRDPDGRADVEWLT